MTEATIKETRSGAHGRYVLAAADGDSELTYRLEGDRRYRQVNSAKLVESVDEYL